MGVLYKKKTFFAEKGRGGLGRVKKSLSEKTEVVKKEGRGGLNFLTKSKKNSIFMPPLRARRIIWFSTMMKRDQPWLCASLHGRPESGDELVDRRFLPFGSSSPPAVVTDTKNDLQKAQICGGPFFFLNWFRGSVIQCSLHSAVYLPH